MRKIALLLILCCLSLCKTGPMKVSPNRKHVVVEKVVIYTENVLGIVNGVAKNSGSVTLPYP